MRIFAFLGLVLGVVIGIPIYTSYGLANLIIFQGLLTYGTLGLVLGLWHGWIVGGRWPKWKKAGLALIGSFPCAALWVVLVNTVIGHAALPGSLQAAMEVLTSRWVDALILVLTAGIFLARGSAVSFSVGTRRPEVE